MYGITRMLPSCCFYLSSPSAATAQSSDRTSRPTAPIYRTGQSTDDFLRTPTALGSFRQPDTGSPATVPEPVEPFQFEKGRLTSMSPEELRAHKPPQRHAALQLLAHMEKTRSIIVSTSFPATKSLTISDQTEEWSKPEYTRPCLLEAQTTHQVDPIGQTRIEDRSPLYPPLTSQPAKQQVAASRPRR